LIDARYKAKEYIKGFQDPLDTRANWTKYCESIEKMTDLKIYQQNRKLFDEMGKNLADCAVRIL
jgi:hypothetical protein